MNTTVFYFLDSSLNILAAVDIYKSAIFTGRYYREGDFELYIPAKTQLLALAKSAAFIARADKPTRCGIVEKVGVQTSAEQGNFVTISGRDVAALLERRIVWRQTTYSGNAEKVIRNLITTAFIEPEIADRAVDNFVLGDEIGLTEKVRVQYTGDTIASAVQAICKSIECGYRVDLDLANKRFIFQLYRGVDRSFAQNTNPFVIFSSDFANLISSTYDEDSTLSKNVLQVAGEGQGNERVKVSVGNASGIDRVEGFVNAVQTSNNQGELDRITYQSVLAQEGAQKLAQLVPTQQIDGEIAPNYQYTLGVDYDLGDVVQIENEYGFQMQPRIIEVIENWSEEGYTCIPTFSQSTEDA